MTTSYLELCITFICVVLDFPQHWNKLHTSGGPSPSARFYHAACCIAPRTKQDYPLLLVGGGISTRGDVLKDMFMLDVGREMWNEVSYWDEPSLSEPTPAGLPYLHSLHSQTQPKRIWPRKTTHCHQRREDTVM